MKKEELNNKFFMGQTMNTTTGKVDVVTPMEPFALEKAQLAKAKELEEQEKAKRLLIELRLQKQKEIMERAEKLDILPLGTKLIMLPYPENPYKRVYSDSGIILSSSGAFRNPDTGEWDQEKELIGCAKIIEVGPECKSLQPGDDVFYDTRSVYPVPFMSQGYILTTEPQILCVLNEGLKERFKMK